MKVLCYVVLFGSFLFCANGAGNEGECDIEGISESEWDLQYNNDPMNDDQILRKVFRVNGNIELAEPTKEKYIQATIETNDEGSFLVISTTEEFKNYEQNEPNAEFEPSIHLSNILLKCKTTTPSQLSFHQPIIDVNNHHPEFAKSEYIYKVPMPFMPNVELSNFGDVITAKDIDLTNMKITFAIKPEGDFEVSSLGPIDDLKKTHRAVIKAARYLKFDEKKSYTITATDGASEPKSKEATFVIDVDKESSFPGSPEFSKSVFNATYQVQGDDHDLVIEAITLIKNYENVKVSLTGSNADYFNAQRKDDKVEIIIKNKLPDSVLEKEMLLTLTLTGERENAENKAVAIIVVALPKQNTIESPTFLKPTYSAKYVIENGNHNLDMTETITLSKDYENIKIALSGTNSEHFNFARNGNKIDITLKNNQLPEDVLEKEKIVALTITADLEGADHNGNTVLIIDLPQKDPTKTPSFIKEVYKANYDDSNEKHTIKLEETIKLSEDYQNIDIELSGTYRDYFIHDRANSDIKIELAKNLEQSILDSEHVVFLTISAKDKTTGEKGNTVLAISLPEQNIAEPPSFTKASYKATYDDTNEKHLIKFEENALLANDYDNVDISLTGSHQDYFEFSKDGKTILVKLKMNLPETVLQNEKIVLLTLSAKIDSAKTVGNTAIVIALPVKDETASPTFEKPNYVATYDDTAEKHLIIFKETISLSNDYQNVDVVLSGTHQLYFELKKDNKNILVTLKDNLPESVLQTEKVIVLTLSAKIEGAKNDGVSSIVITLPERDEIASPTFEKPNYVATYDDTAEKHTITFKETIALSNDYQNVDVILSGTHQLYFELKKDNKNILVTLKDNLPESVLQTEKVVLLTLSAKIEGAKNDGVSSIVITLPQIDEIASPTFEKPNYVATYDDTAEKHTITFKETIALVKDYQNVDVILSGTHQLYFELKKDNKNILVTLKNNLPESVLQTEKVVLLTLSAKIEGAKHDGVSSIVITLPQSDEIASPTFEKPNYVATYDDTAEKHTITFKETIALVKDYQNVDVILSGTHQLYFELTKDSKNILVTLKNNLPESVLQTEKVIVLTLSAKIGGAKYEGHTSVVITLPKQGDITLPTFEKSFYAATYDDKNNSHTINFAEKIKLSENYENNAAIALTGNNADHFNYERDGSEIKVTLKSNLPESVLEKETSLLLTLTVSILGVEQKGDTILVIALPLSNAEESPQFEEIVYSASYVNENDPHSIVVDKDIKLSKNFENVRVTLSGDNSDHFKVDHNNADIKITLAKNLPESVLETGKTIVLTITATIQGTQNSGNSMLVIELPKNDKTEETPTFLDNFYKATYDSQNEPHTIEFDKDITLSKEYKNIKLTLSGSNRDHFDVTQNKADVKLTLIKNLPKDVLDKEKTLVLTLGVKFVDAKSESVTVIVIDLPGRGIIENPSFAQPSYEATYEDTEENHSITMSSKIMLTKDYAKATITIKGEQKQFFEFTRIDDKIDVRLSSNLPEAVLLNGRSVVLIFDVEIEGATNNGSTVLIIALPKKDGVEITSYSKTHYLGVYKDDSDKHVVSWNDQIKLMEDYKNSVVELTGDYAENFETERSATDVSVKLKRNLPEEILGNENVIVLTLSVNIIGSIYKGHTVLIVDLPPKDPEETTTTSTTAPNPTQIIEFTKEVYQFITKPLVIREVIGVVVAKSKPITEAVEYSLEYEDGSSTSDLQVNDKGEIINVNFLRLGKHYLIVTGTGLESKAKGTAKVVILVDAITECGGEKRTPNSLLTTHIIEEEENYDIEVFEIDGKDYKYTILDEYPRIGSEFAFSIHPNRSLHCKSINREDALFKDMLVPQVTLMLRLEKIGESRRLKRSTYDNGKKEWLHLDNIPNWTDQMVVSVIIDDVNDNRPVFDENNAIIGYPGKDLALEVSPQYLTIVKATDIDEGYNASIIYKSSSDKVIVHEKSGIVYPTEDIYDDGDFKFKITAIDRDGTGQESIPPLEIEVKFLDKHHISVLTTEKLMLENVDEKLKELSSKTNLNLKYLSASVVPKKDTRGGDYYLKVVTYAFNYQNELVSTKDLSEAVDGSELDEKWDVNSWVSPDPVDQDYDESKVAGLTAAVSVLAVLLVLFLLGAGAFYYFKFRKPYAKMVEDPEPSPQFEKNPKISHADLYNENDTPPRRATGFVFNPPSAEEDDDEFGEEFPRERKKSVAFNENVITMNLDKNSTGEETKL